MNKYLMTAAVACLLGFSNSVLSDEPPTPEQEAFAIKVTDTLTERLFALLLNEFANTTPQNFKIGTAAISLVFDDSQSTFRLVGNLEPLGKTGRPQDVFEEEALALALQGQGTEGTHKVKGKYYFRRSIPLQNSHTSCAICHQNFASPPNDAWVGALMLRVPVEEGTKTK